MSTKMLLEFIFLGLALFSAVESARPTKPGYECDRACDGVHFYTCIFNWTVQNQFIDLEMCLENPGNCFGDGYSREVTTVRDDDSGVSSIPGPGMVLCHGDKVTVNVFNALESKDSSLHWHGLTMKTYDDADVFTQFADGAPYVTQCPIKPQEMFKWYNFDAVPSGTHWYHSHTEFQRDDGVFGPLIVKENPEETKDLPNSLQNLLADSCDMTEHTIIVKDWFLNTAEYRFTHFKAERATSILVNGKGRADPHNSLIPWHIFNVNPSQCLKYRFRLISTASNYCPIQFSIDDHSLTVIATDGHFIEPEENVASITVSNAERYDFIVDTTGKDQKSYVMRFGSEPDCFLCRCVGLSSIGFLRYGDSEVDQSIVADYNKSVYVPGRHINPLPERTLPANQIGIAAASLRSVHPISKDQVADKTFYLESHAEGIDTANFNKVVFDISALKSPLLSQENDIDENIFCSTSYFTEGINCNPHTDPHHCRCVNIISVDKDDVVDIFFLNLRQNAHPMHLHGYWYNILGTGPLPGTNQLQYVKHQNEIGNIPRNFDHPPRKDVIQIPLMEYTLIRFVADNPGYWFLHCHMSFHFIQGLAAVLKVGDSDDWNVPPDFPTCGV